jgi:nucleoside-diphosphate-sugar epimerase
MAQKTVLIAGASGLVGQAALRRFCEDAEWRVIGVSRRPPSAEVRAEHISVDLTDADACRRALGGLNGVTHIVYAALNEEPGLWAGWISEQNIALNTRMATNFFEPVLAAAGRLEHVSLLHGTKAYGLHHPSIGPAAMKIPLREREPRREHPNFYFLQEDFLRERQQGHGWGLTVFRPTVIYGESWGNNMNPLPVIGAYAALAKERGEPLRFPGREGIATIREAVDADLVAEAVFWAATSPAAGGGTYNLTNGDVFMWPNVWPAIAEAFEMEVGEPQPASLTEELPRRQDEWGALVRRHGLHAPGNILEFVGANSLIYTDGMLAGARELVNPNLNSTIAARQAGFAACIDTEDMFRKWFRKMREERVLV